QGFFSLFIPPFYYFIYASCPNVSAFISLIRIPGRGWQRFRKILPVIFHFWDSLPCNNTPKRLISQQIIIATPVSVPLTVSLFIEYDCCRKEKCVIGDGSV
ncbi:MAG: hypothetical protein K6F61_05365, partial [Clostridiales bacterium]|nr:hypothetical protein [Clostridiales bacterium]